MPKTRSWGTDHIDPSNPEFEALIRAHIGTPYTSSVDKSKAQWVNSPPLNLLGLYVHPTAAEDSIAGLIRQLLRVDASADIQPDSVYTFGPKADPTVWSHEFRHRAVMPEDDEGENRVRDAYYAASPKAWEAAQASYHDWRRRFVPEISREESDKQLLGHLKFRTFDGGFIGDETARNLKAGGPPMEVLGRVLAALGFPSDEFKNTLAYHAPWTHWVPEAE